MSRVKDVNNLAFDNPMPPVARFQLTSRKNSKQRKAEDERLMKLEEATLASLAEHERLKKLEEATLASLALISDEEDITESCDEPSHMDIEQCDLD
jgi:hypothetical protein